MGGTKRRPACALGLACLLGLLAVGCVESSVTVCASGRVCPAGAACDDPNERCVADEQLAACAGRAEGDACDVFDLLGTCVAGACEVASCGNGTREAGEICDDGNRVDGDGCRNDCGSDESCGNAVTDFQAAEQCDCGGGDLVAPGCDTPNRDDGGLCRTDCRLHCGDGEVRGGELCDGAPTFGDHCVARGFDYGALGCVGCALGFSACRDIGIHVTSPAFSARGVWGSGPDDVFAVGDLGTFLHFDGQVWTAFLANFVESVTDVSGSGPDDVFAVVHQDTASGVLHFDGTAWMQTGPIPDNSEIEAAWSAGAGTAFAVGALGRSYRFDGTSWTAMTNSVNAQRLRDVWGSSPSDVWAVGDSGTVLHYDGNGAGAWQGSTLPVAAQGITFVSVYGVGPGDVLIAGEGVLLRGDGTTWADITPPGATSLTGVFATGPSSLTAIEASGRVFVGDGARWTELANDTGASLAAVWASPSGEIFLASSSGILRDTGMSWLTPTAPPSDLLTVDAMWSPGPDAIYVAGQNGGMGYDLAHWDGVAWQAADLGGSVERLASIWGVGADVFAVGSLGTIVRGGGLSFAPMASSTTSDLLAVAGRDASDVVAVGAGGTIVEFDGATWQPAASGVAVELRDVWVGEGLAVAVGEGGTILHRVAGAWVAQPSPTSSRLNAVWGAGPSLVYAVGELGLVLRHDGTAWTQVATPATSVAFVDVDGTGADDVFVIGNRTMLHGDGRGFTPVRLRPSLLLAGLSSLRIVGREILFLSSESTLVLDNQRVEHLLRRVD